MSFGLNEGIKPLVIAVFVIFMAYVIIKQQMEQT